MTANQILDHMGLAQGTASTKDIRTAWYACGDEGPIQDVRVLMKLFPGDPTLHSCVALDTALRDLGCVDQPAYY